jgi:hypothetical protein
MVHIRWDLNSAVFEKFAQGDASSQQMAAFFLPGTGGDRL